MAGEQELEVEGRESSEAGFVERLRVDLRLGLGEEFIVVLPENRALRGDGFEAVTMQMVCEFTGKLVDAVEIGVELVAAVGRPDEPTVAKPLEDAVDRVAVVVAPVGDLGRRFAAGRGSTAPRVPFRSAARGTRCGSAGGRGPDSVRRREHPTGRLVFAGHRVPCRRAPSRRGHRRHERDNSRCGRVSSRVRRSCRRGRLWRGPQAQYAGARCNILRNRFIN